MTGPSGTRSGESRYVVAALDPRYQFLLQAVYDRFREHATWPLVRHLEIDLEDQLDPLGGLEQVCIAIGADKIACGSFYDASSVCRLRLAGFLECRGAEDDVERFLKAVRYCAKKYRDAKGATITVSAGEFVEALPCSETEARRVGLMLVEAGDLWNSATQAPGIWSSFTLGPLARSMKDISSLPEFFEVTRAVEERQRTAAFSRFQRTHGAPAIQRPPVVRRVFLSHSALDRELAELVREHLGEAQVFMASKPGSIRPGQEWLDTVFENLREADYYLVLLTHNSKERPWVWFESGAAWMSEGILVVVVAGGLSVGEVPYPLAWQVHSLENPEEAAAVFRELGVELSDPGGFAKRARELGRGARTRGLQEAGWRLVEVGARRFAWAGPLQELEDRAATMPPPELHEHLSG